MTFKHLNTIFHHVTGKHNQPFTFWYCVDNFYPWKDIVGKKVSKLRSIAELRAFDGILYATRQTTHLRHTPNHIATLLHNPNHLVAPYPKQLNYATAQTIHLRQTPSHIARKPFSYATSKTHLLQITNISSSTSFFAYINYLTSDKY